MRPRPGFAALCVVAYAGFVPVPCCDVMRNVARLFIPWVRSAFVALVVALAGCATRSEAPAQVSENSWRLVDNDVAAASLAARVAAENYAKGEMERWRGRIHDLTEEAFIPWFTGYWTQQWLAVKVAWYKLGGDDVDPATQRLAAYLQEQYREQVLEPVAEEVDPDAVRVQATRLYVERLAATLRELPQRHGVPLAQFEARLAGIPAIALALPDRNDERSASLLQLVRADPVTRLPAFAALLTRIDKAASGEGATSSAAHLSLVARRASEKLATRFASSGGASAAAAAIGGVAGVVISLGSFGFGAIAHADDEPAMEAQLRESLDAAADEMWLVLSEDPSIGVMAGVLHISARIEERVVTTIVQPVTEHPMVGETFLVDEPIAVDEKSEHYDHGALERFGHIDE